MRALPFSLAIACGVGAPGVGCIVPPDGLEPPIPPFPPTVDLGMVRPPEPRLRLRLNPPCNFPVEVEGIVDRDSRNLRYRFVVNNNLPGTRLLEEQPLPPLDPGTGLRARWRLNVLADLDVDGTGLEPGDTPMLSFFVTDAPRFAAEPPDAGPFPDEVADLGAIPDGEGSVVEIRWAFTFAPDGSGACPQ